MPHLYRQGRWALLLTALSVCTVQSQERVGLCATCHGPDGNSANAGVPSIAGQPKLFIENQLVLFREGMRESDQKFAALKGMKDPEIIRLAEHFSKLPAKQAPGVTDKSLFQKGQALAKSNRCGICHLPNFAGRAQMPRLAGQREDYLLKTLKDYRDKPRAGGDTVMTDALRGVPDADIAALAHFLARSR